MPEGVVDNDKKHAHEGNQARRGQCSESVLIGGGASPSEKTFCHEDCARKHYTRQFLILSDVNVASNGKRGLSQKQDERTDNSTCTDTHNVNLFESKGRWQTGCGTGAKKNKR